MRIGIVWIILCKELMETLRDRRTLVRLILVPILMYPLFAIGVARLQGSEIAAREARSSRVAVWGQAPSDLLDRLNAVEKFEFLPWAYMPSDVRQAFTQGQIQPALAPDPAKENQAEPIAHDPPNEHDQSPEQHNKPWIEPDNPVLLSARNVVTHRDVDAVLVAWPVLVTALETGQKGQLSIYYDSVRADSMMARQRLEKAIKVARREIVAEREVQRDLPKGFSTAIDILIRNVAIDSRRAGHILGAAMPLFLILMSLLGSFLPAIDVTAGEKERGTMQTLLCAPLRPIEIIVGKFVAVWCIALIAALANVVSLALTITRILPDELVVATGIYLVSFLLLIPITFIVSALFLALAVFAKDFKEAQNVLMPVYLPMAILAGISALPDIELSPWTTFVPILNIACLIKSLFLGEVSAKLILLTSVSSLLYSALALLLAARVFEREQVLLGGRESTRTVLGLTRRQGGEPSVGFSLTAFAAILVLFFYGTLFLERYGTITTLTVTEIGFFLIPAVTIVLAFGFSPKQTLALRLPSLRGSLGAILLGLSGWIVVSGILLRLLPPPEPLTRELAKRVLLDGQPLIVTLLITALIPAICEEVVFRGVVYSGLKRLGPPAAIIVSAILFGVAHGSLARVIPTTFLGLGMGYARYRTNSIVAGGIMHLLNNGIAVSLLYFSPPWLEGMTEGGMPWTVTAAGVALFVAGLLLLKTSPAPELSPGPGPNVHPSPAP